MAGQKARTNLPSDKWWTDGMANLPGVNDELDGILTANLPVYSKEK